MEPLIGILVCAFSGRRQFVTDDYVKAVRLSGGIPVLIPAVFHRAAIQPYLDVCDAFLLPGGGDFTPFVFGEAPLVEIGTTNLAFDMFQIHFTEEIIKRKKPVLGICRGMQLLNAACGGTLYQDVSLQPGDTFQHMQTSQNRSDICHKVLIEQDSILREIIGDSIFTNSFHHQSICLPGENIHVCGRSEDGTIEAVEVEGLPFGVGVQWHPEAMFSSSESMRSLFFAFINSVK